MKILLLRIQPDGIPSDTAGGELKGLSKEIPWYSDQSHKLNGDIFISDLVISNFDRYILEISYKNVSFARLEDAA